MSERASERPIDMQYLTKLGNDSQKGLSDNGKGQT
jgi:hypothetical protein